MKKKHLLLLCGLFLGTLSLYGEEATSHCTPMMREHADSMLRNGKDMQKALDQWEELGCPGTNATNKQCRALRKQFDQCVEERRNALNLGD